MVVYVQFMIMLTVKESAKSTKVFVWQDYHSPIRMNCTKNY
jgi:hypothetical protein